MLTLAGGSASRATVLISEIMYHPASENIAEEFIELYNPGPTNETLTGWSFAKGVQFTFPAVALGPGNYLVVAADLATFSAKYPGVTNVIGNWTGRLSNSHETIELQDADGGKRNSVAYADEGDWATRQRGPLDHNHRGWLWFAAHDGGGRSLELINPQMPNSHGQNWAASLATNGTPGVVNSQVQTNVPPVILEVRHLPLIPRSVDPVLITARALDERGSNVTASLSWRLDGSGPSFGTVPMLDDGLNNDGVAKDGVFGASLPPQANNAIIEFYVTATDQDGLPRTWPAPAIDTDGTPLGQAANALYQVDDSDYAGTFPLFKVIMKEANRTELAVIGAPNSADQTSDAQMNATFISLDGNGANFRYVTGVRNRGHGSRDMQPNNYRVNFSTGDPWKGVTALNINGQYTHSQLLGAVLALKSGLGGADSLPVQVRVNNLNLANNGPQTYGGVYVANEVVNSDWAEHWFPNDSSGNLYRALRDLAPDDFAYRGTNFTAYTNTWFKQSNNSENDWRDLIGLLRVVGTNDQFATPAVRAVANVEQWMNYLAVMALFNNRETSIGTGYNDDYFFYAGINDPRFHLMYYDLDSLMGEGDTTGTTNASIFAATNLPAFNRLLRWPEFEPIYFRTLQHLLATTFAKAEFDSTIDQTLGGFVPANIIAKMKTWMDGRRAYVQSVIAPYVATNGLPPVARISGEPRSPTPLTTATLTVAGADVTQYRFSLNGGPFSDTNSVATPIVLSNLPHGSSNFVRVIAAGTNGAWPSVSNATLSRSWVVNTSWPAVRINEVLARNVAALNHNGTFPDAIELFNEGSATADLSGLRLTDNAASPNKFSFPNGTTLATNRYLVVYANNADGTPGLHTGFSLNQDGEGVFLFDKVASGGALLDSVSFGLQLPDLSIGRVNSGGEFLLTQPTLGTNNAPQSLGDPRDLKINEWLASGSVVSPTDFVELFNRNTLPVSLGGLNFTDNAISEPFRSPIAPLSFIAGGGFRLFKADSDPQQGNDHLAFKLAAEQGMIALLQPDAEILDLVLYGPQRTDVSQGRSPDGSTRIQVFETPTPGDRNSPGPVCTTVVSNLALMSLNQVWRYNQTNNLDAAGWPATNFNDSTWPAGPGLLAFESNNAINALIHTTLTDPKIPPPGLTPGHAYYFRTSFALTNNLAGFNVTASAYIDDGAVIYVNGNEVFPRIRLAGGATTNATLATGTPSGGDATTPDTFLIPATMFVPGTNVIAVEVHQSATNSTDIVWGMALTASAQLQNCEPATVVLNEIFARNQSFTNAAGRAPDWIELFNATTNSVDLSDFSLTDAAGALRKWVFPSGSSIGPLAHLVIECDDGVPASTTNTGFALGASGGAVFLVKRPADGGTVLDSLNFGFQAADYSLGRIEDGNGDWALTLPTRGAANVAASLGNASSLKLNEWLASSPGEADWLELFNPEPQPVALAGLALTDDASVHDQSPLPSLSFIGPQRHRKLIADSNRGAGADHVGFNLAAAGDFLGLYWPVGTQIDARSFGPQTSGVAEGRFPDGAENIVGFPQSASPGAPNYLLLTNLVINEALSHTDPPIEDAVEIFNAGGSPVNIGDWYLSNSGEELRKYRVPANTVVPAGGFAVFYEYQFNSNGSPAVLAPFTLNSAHGDEVHLAQTDGASQLTGYRARAKFGAAPNGVSFGRFLTSVGEEFVPMSGRSFGEDDPPNLATFRLGAGQTNPYPLVGPVVFSEIHFRPTNSYLGDTHAGEFLELLNLNSNAVALFDPAALTNTWRIAGGVNFDIPANLTLGAGKTLLLVSFDPSANPDELEWFRSAYGISPGVVVLGPWTGALADEGEGVKLLRPDPPQLPPHPDAGFVPFVLVEQVRHLPTAPWATNGLDIGASLQRIAPTRFGNEPLNWTTARPSPGFGSLTDSDADGLPDYWELDHGLNPTNATAANGADGDGDGDGQSNRAEFLAGMNPTDAGDFLHIETVTLTATNLSLHFRAAGSHTYSVLYSDVSPTGPWFKLADAPASANASAVSVADTNPIAPARFYRLVSPSR